MLEKNLEILYLKSLFNIVDEQQMKYFILFCKRTLFEGLNIGHFKF